MAGGLLGTGLAFGMAYGFEEKGEIIEFIAGIYLLVAQTSMRLLLASPIEFYSTFSTFCLQRSDYTGFPNVLWNRSLIYTFHQGFFRRTDNHIDTHMDT